MSKATTFINLNRHNSPATSWTSDFVDIVLTLAFTLTTTDAKNLRHCLIVTSRSRFDKTVKEMFATKQLGELQFRHLWA